MEGLLVVEEGERTQNLVVLVVVEQRMLALKQSQLLGLFLQLQINCAVDIQAPDLAWGRLSSALAVY